MAKTPRRWRVITGKLAGTTGVQIGSVGNDLVLRPDSRPSISITVAGLDCVPDWRVGDEVVSNGLRGTITRLGEDLVEIHHPPIDDLPAVHSVVPVGLVTHP